MPLPIPGYLAHLRSCQTKQHERDGRIAALSPLFHEAPTTTDKEILRTPISTIVRNVQRGALQPSEILTAYGKQALRAHAETNCLTEIMIAEAQDRARSCRKDGPLAGVPVSLKDTVGVEGWDACIGYSSWVGKPSQKDSALIRLLRDAGALVPFVKTNVPITLLSFESANDVFGRTTNPHNRRYSPGGSTGGEATLLALGGSRIGIGTDVAGSVRVPAHYSGVYTIKASVGRFMKWGSSTSMPGQEGVAPVYSPMARTLEDLETFWKAVVSMEPWRYDHSCLPIPWRPVEFAPGKKIRWGVLWDDGVVQPSPACRRALQIVVDVLQKAGHDVFPVSPPSPYEGLKIGSSLLLADGAKTVTAPMRPFESNDPGVIEALRMFRLPRFLRWLYVLYIRYIKRDEVYAGLLDGWHEKKVVDYWPLIARKEGYKAQWFDYWQKEELDFLLAVPNALPAVPHGGMKQGWRSCGYTFLFNVLDYAAGVLPITHVHKTMDQLGTFKARNAIEQGAYRDYDAEDMHGLPIGIQVVGQRLEEEKVMEGMKIIEALLRKEGKEYQLLEI